jgi:transcriptional regulator of arginine metabolism
MHHSVYLYMPRSRRHNLLKQLLSNSTAKTQDLLVLELENEGIQVTQATISRDLSAIGAVRSPNGYLLPSHLNHTQLSSKKHSQLQEIIEQHALRITPAASIVVVHTAPGHANFVASELDTTRPKGMVGTIAGDDTIFIATASNAAAKALCKELSHHIGGGT